MFKVIAFPLHYGQLKLKSAKHQLESCHSQALQIQVALKDDRFIRLNLGLKRFTSDQKNHINMNYHAFLWAIQIENVFSSLVVK